jgi:hypothetical protein
MKREPARLQVEDEATERAIDEVRRSVVELCRDPYLSGVDLLVTLPNGVATNVKHGLERRFSGYSHGAPIGAIAAGYVVESTSTDPARYVRLTANGYGATIQLRLRVW